MKLISLTIITLLFYQLVAQAQSIDSALAKKITINGFCLCQTSLASLKQFDASLKEVVVEEMDLAKGCYGQDSRFIAGKGYASEKQPGMIFQRDQQNDLISKIRLTQQFKGKLPDGNFIDLSNLVLKDLLKLYPKLKDKWGSRGCSDYWNFSNDTVSFYVKVDKTKQPQFPVDEAYYADKPIVAVDLMISCYGLQKDDAHAVTMEHIHDPVMYVDSVKIAWNQINTIDAKNISSLTVYKDSDAIKRGGEEAAGGLIYAYTKKYDRGRFIHYFKTKSAAFAKLVTGPDEDNSIQYILNNKVLKENYEGDLASINDGVFKEIKIINKQELYKEYGVRDKTYGVIIRSDAPANLHNGKSKF